METDPKLSSLSLFLSLQTAVEQLATALHLVLYHLKTFNPLFAVIHSLSISFLLHKKLMLLILQQKRG